MTNAFLSRASALAALGLGLGAAATALGAGCSGDEAQTSAGGTASGGETTSSSTTTAATTTTSSSTTGGGGEGGATTASSTAGAGGEGGAGGGGGAWPTCDAQPAGSTAKTLHAIWQDDPAAPTPVWVEGVIVTAVGKGGCVAGEACQIFVQSDKSYPDLAAGSQQALKIFASAATAEHFTAVKVGDTLNVYAHAWRYDVDGQHELLLQVNSQLEGCAKVVSSGSQVTPVTVDLADLTVSAYEDTVGPLLVRVETVSGTPALPDETFGLYDTGVFNEAGIETVTSLSPFFLANGAFVGLAAGKKHDFLAVTGVFGLFVPVADPLVKYEEIYPRTMADVEVLLVAP